MSEVGVAPLNLRAERLRRGMSARAIAIEIEVSEDVLLWAERTGRRPSPENALKIAKFYGIDVLDQWPLKVIAA
jgi:transcriptional regulator with XRE-family HTH domain